MTDAQRSGRTGRTLQPRHPVYESLDGFGIVALRSGDAHSRTFAAILAERQSLDLGAAEVDADAQLGTGGAGHGARLACVWRAADRTS